MAAIYRIVSGVLSATASGTLDLTHADLPDTIAGAIVVSCRANTTNNPEAGAAHSIGFWDGTNQAGIGMFNDDNLGTTATSRYSSTTRGLIVYATGVTRFSISAATKGITLTLSDDGTSVQFYVTALLFSGISASLVTLTSGATFTTGALPFEPKLALLTSIGNTSVGDAGASVYSFGAVDENAVNRLVAQVGSSGQTAALEAMTFSETQCIGEVSHGSFSWSASATMDADSVDFTRNTGSAADICFALVLGGADFAWDIGTYTTRTTNGDNVVSTDITPDAVLVALSTCAVAGTFYQDSHANGFAVGIAGQGASALEQYSHNYSVEDAADPTNTNSVRSTVLVDLDSSSGGSRTDLVAGSVTLNSSDFTVAENPTDGTARKGWWVAFGQPAGGGGGSPVPLILDGIVMNGRVVQ